MAMAGAFNSLGNWLTGGGPSAGQQLSDNGWKTYDPTQGPNVAGSFQGYQGAQAQTGPYGAAQSALLSQLGSEASGTGGPTIADQQLQAGTGQALSAQKAAMAGQRGQNAGLASAQLGNNLASTTAGAAGAAGAQRAQEQMAAQSGLQGAINQGDTVALANQASTNQGLAATSNAAQNYGSLQNQNWQYLNNMGEQQDAQWNQSVGSMTGAQAASDASVGNALGGMVLPNFSDVADGGIFGMDDGGVVDINPDAPTTTMPSNQPAPAPASKSGSGAGGLIGGLLALLSDGGMVSSQANNTPQFGPGIKVEPALMQQGGQKHIDYKKLAQMFRGTGSGGSGTSEIHSEATPASAVSPGQLSVAQPGIGQSDQAPTMLQANPADLMLTDPSQMGFKQSSATIGSPGTLQNWGPGSSGLAGAPSGEMGDFGSDIGDAVGAANGMVSAPPPSQFDLTGPGGGTGGGTGYDPTARMGGEARPMADGWIADCNGQVAGMADGGVAAPVARGPTKAIIGENGPEAVVPIKANGDVDPARARNPGLQQLLASHPGLSHIQDAGQPQGQPTGTGDRATAAALAMAGAHLSDRVAALEQLLSSQARKSQRRAA